MLGHGGNFVGLMPNNMVAVRFAESDYGAAGIWDRRGRQVRAHALRQFCKQRPKDGG